MSRNSTRRKGGNSRARLRLPRLFPPLECPGCGARIMRRALGGACILRPLPLLRLAVSAAGGARLRSPSTKFYGKSRTRRFAPRTQFAVKFPCRCRRRRRMSADGDDFRFFRQFGLPCKGRCRLRRRRGALPLCGGAIPARLPQRPPESRCKHRPAGVSRRRRVFAGKAHFQSRPLKKPPLQGEVPPPAAEGCIAALRRNCPCAAAAAPARKPLQTSPRRRFPPPARFCGESLFPIPNACLKKSSFRTPDPSFPKRWYPC